MTEKTDGICCPDCNCGHHYVLDTVQKRKAIVRYRECRACGKRFSTREKIKASE